MPNRRAPPRAAILLLAAACLAAGAWQAGFFGARVGPGLFPDERAHVSYARDAAAREAFVPRYEAMRLLEADGTFGREPNYLPHPPVTYRLAAGLEGPLGLPGAPGLEGAIRSLRRAALPLFVLALAAALLVLLPSAATAGGALFLGAALLSVPMVSFGGASPNPDTLALLGGSVMAAGALRAGEGRADLAAGLLLGGGTAVASLAKFTGALLCGLLLVFLLVRASRRGRWGARLGGTHGPPPRFFAAALLPLVLPALFWGAVVARYGTPVPSLSVTNPRAFAESPWGGQAAGKRLSPGAFLLRTARVLDLGFRSVASHVVVPAPRASVALRLVPLVALVGLLLPPSGREDAGRLFVLRAAAAATAAVLALNVLVAWRDHVRNASLFGVQARYYFPLLPLLLLPAARALERIPSPRLAAAACWGGALLLLAGEAALLAAGSAAGAW